MKDEISEFRAEVIEMFSNLENVIAAIISQHYFGNFKTSFVLQVLYDEQCTFALKRNILTKIVPDLDKKMVEHLHRLNRLRNIFAHCSLKLFEGMPPDSGKFFFPDPRDPAGKLDFKTMYKEFIQLCPKVNMYLLGIAKEKGMKFEYKSKA